MDFERLQSLAIALFIGALIGTERTLHKQVETGDFVGLRTFILLSQAGAIAAWLSVGFGTHSLFIAGLVSVTAVLLSGFYLIHRKSAQPVGLTTEIAAIITYLLGGACVYGHSELAVAMAVITSGLLALKTTLHGAVRAINTTELLAALRLLFATFIILPLLPRIPIDPWGALNPYKLWVLVILISALSMSGYIAVRWLGQDRGTALTGFFGGIVSSTAVTLSFARRSREDVSLTNALVVGLLLSWAVMFIRVIIEVAVVNRGLLAAIIPPMVVMAGVAAVVAGTMSRFVGKGNKMQEATEKPVPLQNPFRLWAAIQFAALFAFVTLAAKLMQTYVSPEGLYLVAALSGTTDVDPITLSLAQMAQRNEITPTLAANAITTAVATNTLSKAALTAVLGSRVLGWRVAGATALILVCGAAAVFIW